MPTVANRQQLLHGDTALTPPFAAAAPRRVRPSGAPRSALPGSHPFFRPALCGDGLLLLFVAFAYSPASGGRGTRTPDLISAIDALSRLSYAPRHGNNCGGSIDSTIAEWPPQVKLKRRYHTPTGSFPRDSLPKLDPGRYLLPYQLDGLARSVYNGGELFTT